MDLPATFQEERDRLNPARRRCLWLLPTVLCGGLLTACAALEPGGGITSRVLSARELSDLLARAFPYTRDVSGLASLTLQNPKLRLLPERNRLGTGFDLLLAETLTGSQARAGMDLDYGLRFDSEAGAVRMTDVQLNRLDVDRLSPRHQALLSQYAPPLARQLLDDFELYRLPGNQLALARNLGMAVGALRVAPEGLRIVLGPRA